MTETVHAGLVVGVDTHRDTHTAAICDQAGRQLGGTTVPATAAGYAQLLDWARAQAGDASLAWGIEGTRHYGLGLSRHLAAHGQRVAEIDHSRRAGRRRAGKTDPIDAVRAAREFLARPDAGQARCDGDREALRLLITDRDQVTGALRVARTQLAALLVTAPEDLRAQLRSLPAARRVRTCAALACPPGAGRLTQVQYQTLARAAQRILDLTAEAAQLRTQIAVIAEDLAPGWMASEPGLGPVTAATILLAWSHRGRIRSEAAFAMIAGVAPLPASSGRTIRYRLNRGGDRQLNAALHTIAINRTRHDPATRAYITRRRADGKTDREIRRCLKRYLARHLFRTLNQIAAAQPSQTT